jgi:hypothetical protein
MQTINENRVFSYWEVQREQGTKILNEKQGHSKSFLDEQLRMSGMSLQALYKRPPPIWLHPMFLGL